MSDRKFAVRPSELGGSRRIATTPTSGGHFPAKPLVGARPYHLPEAFVVLAILAVLTALQWVFATVTGGV